MDLLELKVFLSLAENLHFGRTSRACNLSPSAISRLLQRIEEAAGVPLFLRSKRSVELTPEGQAFRQFARDTLESWEAFRDAAQKTGGGLSGELRLFCTVTASYAFLPPLLTRLNRDHPSIHVRLQTGDAGQAIPQVLEGKADISIAPQPESLPPVLAFKPLVETDLVFVIPRRRGPVRSLFERKPVDYSRVPMVLSEHELSRRRVEKWFAGRGITPRVYALVSGNEAILAMVSLGLGAGVLPSLVAKSSPLRDRVTVRPLDPPLAPYVVGLCALKRRLPLSLVHAFWEGTPKGTRALSSPSSRRGGGIGS
jgi:LysR family transcriptional regulator, positive regulator for ilvC